MTVIATRKQGTSGKQLGENATNGPDIDCLDDLALKETCRGCRTYLGIHLERKHDLGRTVPSCGHVFSHQADFLAPRNTRLHTPSETEVTDFEITVCVEKEIGWFKITVHDVSAVD